MNVTFLVRVWFEAGEVKEEDGVGMRGIVVETSNAKKPNAGQREGGT